MRDRTLSLTTLPRRLAVCRLEPDEAVPDWGTASPFHAVTRTAEELSLVVPEASVPEGVRCERGFRALKVAGPLDLSLTGVLASLAVPLAEAGVPIFALSTFDTDYLLVRETDLPAAVEALARSGHRVA